MEAKELLTIQCHKYDWTVRSQNTKQNQILLFIQWLSEGYVVQQGMRIVMVWNSLGIRVHLALWNLNNLLTCDWLLCYSSDLPIMKKNGEHKEKNHGENGGVPKGQCALQPSLKDHLAATQSVYLMHPERTVTLHLWKWAITPGDRLWIVEYGQHLAREGRVHKSN